MASLSVTAEEFPGGTATAVAYPVGAEQRRRHDPQRGVVPSAVNQPIIFEPPSSMTNGASRGYGSPSRPRLRRAPFAD